LYRSDRSTVSGRPLSRQQASDPAIASQPDPKAAASTMTGPDGFGGGRSATPVKEATDVAAAKEATTKKMTTDMATVKKATDDVVAWLAAEDFTKNRASTEKLLRSRQLRELQRWM
jgi:hypothetical protein